MGKAYELPKSAKCGLCKSKIKEGDIFTIIYKDDDSGNIKYLLCDNCEVDDTIAEYRRSGYVSSRLSTDAALANYHFRESHLGEEESLGRLRKDVQHYYRKYKKDLLEVADGNDKIHDKIQEFESKHWLPYLKKYWNETDLRGHEAKVGKTKVMMWGCAGRVLITAERGNESVTMIFTDDKEQKTPNGDQQGIDCPQKVALEIIQELIDAKKISFKPQKSVTLAGL